jgi:hypothetical protein
MWWQKSLQRAMCVSSCSTPAWSPWLSSSLKRMKLVAMRPGSYASAHH